jgi:hypothetical protein
MDMADSNHSTLFSTGLNKLPNHTRTMRTSIKIFCAFVIAAICLLVWFRHATEPQPNTSPQSENKLTNQMSQPERPKVAEHPQITNIAQIEAIFPPKTPLAEALAKTNPIAAIRLSMWQAPIEFYGRVVDENSNAISGVNVHFSWYETPAENGEKTSDTQSDSEGLFSLHGKHGPSLSVGFSKEGYYSSHRGEVTFNYALGPDIISPDPRNPVIFNLKKKGIGEHLIRVKQNYRVARDGTPLGINLTTGKAAIGGSGDFVVQCWTDDQGKPSGAKYDWRCVVTIPGGGLVPSNEEFTFLAPENGYALTNEIAMPASRTNWTSDVDLKFYYRLADGRYGRMTFSMIAGGQHFCMIDSLLNPTGSRNLEPK